MSHAVFLALKSLSWHRGRAITIVLCLALTLWVPVSIRMLLNQFRGEITSRAAATPLVVGAPGSRIDLVLHTLHFESAYASATTMAEADYIQETGFALPISLYIRYRTQDLEHATGAPIVGTSPEYFDFRNLHVEHGRMFSLLGECVLGARVADRMKLAAGDSLLSAPRNAFDLAGDYPLKLNITGVLTESHSPDDEAVFCDTQTVWVIDGLGHGHQDLNSALDSPSKARDASQTAAEKPNIARASDRPDPSFVLKTDAKSGTVTASAAVLPYTEITPDNLDSFHFHGDPATFPLSAVIAIPDSDKSRTLLLGRYATVRKSAQCLKPPDVIDELLLIVFRIEQLLRFSSLIAAIVTAILLGLVLSLSLRLRAAEMQTMFRLGCSRGMVARLLSAELALLLITAAGLAYVASWFTRSLAGNLLREMLF